MSIQEKIIKKARTEGDAAYSKVWGQFQRPAFDGSTEILPGISRAGFVKKYINEQIGNIDNSTVTKGMRGRPLILVRQTVTAYLGWSVNDGGVQFGIYGHGAFFGYPGTAATEFFKSDSVWSTVKGGTDQEFYNLIVDAFRQYAPVKVV